MKKKGGLHRKLLIMTLFPLLIMGIVITLFSYMAFDHTMQKEVESGLRNRARSTIYTYDSMYPGDYHLVQEGEAYYLYKGDEKLSGNFEYIDKMKEETDIDLTFFFYDVRVMTTIKDKDGNRIIGTNAHARVIEDVLKRHEATFYHNVLVNDEEYFAYYEPVFASDGTCIGMIFAGKPTKNVNHDILIAVSPILIIAIIMMILTSFICNGFTKELVSTISKEKSFLKDIAQGNLKAELDCRIMQRKDELGEMGRFTVHVQKFLREMVERDALTKLYSRRIGEGKLRNVQMKAIEDGIPFSVVMCDIDFFKKFNDEYGHDCGDLVLKEISNIFNNNMIGKGFAVRWGGEEFLLIYEDKNFENALKELQELRNKIINHEVVYKEKALHITMTFGIVEGSNEEISVIIKKADNRLYKGKMGGRNQIVSE